MCERALAAPSSVSVENLAVLGPGAGGHHGHSSRGPTGGGVRRDDAARDRLGPVLCADVVRCVNRQRGGEVEYCRNNSSGLLLGCWIRQHKFQHFTSAWWITNWRDRMAETGRARLQSLQLFQPGSALSLEQSA